MICHQLCSIPKAAAEIKMARDRETVHASVYHTVFFNKAYFLSCTLVYTWGKIISKCCFAPEYHGRENPWKDGHLLLLKALTLNAT